MPFQDTYNNVLGYLGINPGQNPGVIPDAGRAPTSNDLANIGTLWIHKSANAVYCLSSVVSGAANWELLGSPSGAVSSVDGDSGSASPSSGVLTIAGTANQVGTAAAGSTVTVSLDEAVPNIANVSITSAQVKALETTQITLVAAPGAGKMIKFLGASLKLVYGGNNAFTESGDNLGIKYTDDSGVQVSNTIETTGFIDQTADTYTNAEPATDAIVAAAAAENQALVLDNLGSAIAGNAADDNTLEVSVLYRVVEI